MNFLDCISKEDRVDVKFSDFYKLVRGCAERDILMNAVETRVPHKYIEQMMKGLAGITETTTKEDKQC